MCHWVFELFLSILLFNGPCFCSTFIQTSLYRSYNFHVIFDCFLFSRNVQYFSSLCFITEDVRKRVGALTGERCKQWKTCLPQD